MATYRKRGDSWRVEVCVNGVRTGATFDTKAQARSWAIDKEAALKDQKSKYPKHTLREAFERYRDTVSVGRKGERWETIRLEKFIRTMPFVGQNLQDITTDTLAQWRDSQLKTLQPASVRREMNLLSAVLELARKEWKWIPENPLKDVAKPTKPAARDRLISDAEIAGILEKLGYIEDWPVETKQQQIAVAFLFAIETGMRAGEIVGMRWPEVNIGQRYVSLPDTKNGDSRNVPLSTRAVELLEKLKGLDAEMVFTVDGAVMSTLFRRARDAAGVKDLHFHDTRHEAITRLSKKLTVMQLARMVGHRDLRSLMTYYNETATELAALL